VNPDFQLGPWVVHPTLNSVSHDGQNTHVEPKAMEVLVCLARNSGTVVSKEELLRQVWPDTFASDDVLFRCISELRRVLKDDPKAPQLIETIPKRGYRLLEKAELTVGTVVPAEIRDDPKRWYRFPSVLATILIAAGAIGWGAHQWISRDRRPNLESAEFRKLTDSGKAADAAISPDGHYIAYLYRDENDASLRLRQVGAQGETVVLTHDETYALPTFSPDGSRLYFLRGNLSELHSDLYEMPVLGGPERKVAPSVDSPISFSPDGRQFAYERVMRGQNSDEIRIANVDGSGDRLLVDLRDVFSSRCGPAWSPDGRSIVVSAIPTAGLPVLYVISRSSGEVRQLYSHRRGIGRPRWLLDGRLLVVSIADQQVGHMQLWTVSYPGGEARQLTKDLANYDPLIDTTRDGGILATVQWTIISNVWVSPASDPSSGSQITRGGQRITEIFPFGGRIAMVNRADGKLWIVDEDGTSPRLVSDVVGADSFTGCGPFIVFISHGPLDELRRVNQDGTNPKRLATGDTLGDDACSPDGKFVYYTEHLVGKGKIRRVPIEGGIPIDVGESPAAEEFPLERLAISPDGQLLAFGYVVAQPESAFKIGVIPSAGGPLLKTFDAGMGFDTFRWSPEGQSLQYLLGNEKTNLWEQPLAGGPPRQLTKFASGFIYDFNWTADGKHLLVSRGEATSDVVLLSHLR
jgi:DNA-binding winged helix-turn-helix (wHTH) protein/Tol biopolymer transport system component